ncbi:hypothetical protein ALC53_05557 [Atta colombica]|uniref:Uncharacterized protein n=1 Tax=Atta colombica TaxID=520822 RepID=A0A195BIR4_9HYME|nr:hypothetical protein ALC53_05557 [Atta colombica]
MEWINVIVQHNVSIIKELRSARSQFLWVSYRRYPLYLTELRLKANTSPHLRDRNLPRSEGPFARTDPASLHSRHS